MKITTTAAIKEELKKQNEIKDIDFCVTGFRMYYVNGDQLSIYVNDNNELDYKYSIYEDETKKIFLNECNILIDKLIELIKKA